VRLWLLGNATINSDEATAGLMAHFILRGHPTAIFWGQNYGGVEPFAVAGMFAAFGQSPLALNATPALLAAGASLVVWRIGLRVMPVPAALAAAVLSWVWSECAVWGSTRETGLHQAALLLGLVVILEAIRIDQASRTAAGARAADWLVLGLAAGAGWWASPEIAYFAIPAGVLVVISLRRDELTVAVRHVVVAGVGAVVGALPWISASVRDHFATLQRPASPLSYGARLHTLATHALPIVLGLRIEGAGAWEGSRGLGVTLYAMLIVATLVAMAVLAVRVRDARVLVGFVLLFPFLYAAFPTSWFWNDGRYGIFLPPMLALVWMGGLWEVARSGAKWAAGTIVVAATASTLVAFNTGYGALSSFDTLTAWHENPNPAVTELSRQLERRGVRDVSAGYWVANDLTFLSGGRVTAVASGVSRNPPLTSQDVAAAGTAWVFVPTAELPVVAAQVGSASNVNPGNLDEASLVAWLTSHDIPYHRETIGHFDLIRPARSVSPGELGVIG